MQSPATPVSTRRPDRIEFITPENESSSTRALYYGPHDTTGLRPDLYPHLKVWLEGRRPEAMVAGSGRARNTYSNIPEPRRGDRTVGHLLSRFLETTKPQGEDASVTPLGLCFKRLGFRALPDPAKILTGLRPYNRPHQNVGKGKGLRPCLT